MVLEFDHCIVMFNNEEVIGYFRGVILNRLIESGDNLEVVEISEIACLASIIRWGGEGEELNISLCLAPLIVCAGKPSHNEMF